MTQREDIMIAFPTRAATPFIRRLAAVTGLALALTGIGFTAPAFAVDGPLTVVSLTFDDANADQLTAVDILNSAGMKGTFFVPSGYVGAAGYLTQAQVVGIQTQGHEIGGHTVTHADLTSISAAAAKLQVCEDRATLTSWGLNIRSFAYPFAAVNTAAMAAASECNYNSARGLGDIESRFGCTGCYNAETLPPMVPFYTMALDQQDTNWTIDDLTSAVERAETAGGGWLQYTFHHVCDACDSLSITPALLQQFVDWLAARGTTNNTVVRTVGDAVGGATKPVVASVLPPAPGPGVNGIVNPSLETAGSSGLPQCWQTGAYGVNTPTFGQVTPGRTGAVAEQLVMAGYVDGDAKLLPTLDLGECAPTVTPGHSYSLRSWYTSTAATQFAVYLRNTVGAWNYWTSSPWFAASPAFAVAYWDTPAVPAGSTGMSFGLNLFSNGTLTTDDYALYDTVGAPGPLGDLVAVTPTIAGTSMVGSALTAVPGTWTPDGVAFGYQWMRDGSPISGAITSGYTLVGADAGHEISVSITGSFALYTSATGTSLPSSTILPGDLVPGSPAVTGTAEVGRELSADAGTWGPEAVTFGYQWLRDGSPITDATASTYTATPSDLGSTLSVTVTGSSIGYLPASRTSPSTSTVTPGILTAPVPTVSGNPIVGQTLTADSGTWLPVPVALSYQWLRGVTPIAGATGNTYVLTAADNGAQISVRVEGTKTGYVTASQTSTGAAITDIVPGAPTITGTAEVGKQVTAHPGTWAPVGVTFGYQWMRAGAPIADATTATYSIVADDLAKTLSVQITGSATGYLAKTVSATMSTTVTPGILAGPTPVVTGSPVVGLELTATSGSWDPVSATLSFSWLRNGVTIPGAVGATYLLSAADYNKQVAARVTGTQAGYVTVTRTSDPVTVTKSDYVVARLAGNDRYATSARISEEFAPGVLRAYVASGQGFPDGLSAGAVAAHFDGPLLLTKESSLPDVVRAALVRLAPAEIVIAGGTGVVSAGVLAQLQTIAPVVRVSGADRYATSRALAIDGFASATTAYIATGRGFADGLTASPAAAHLDGPVILVSGTSSSLDAATITTLTALGVTSVRIAGGTSVVSQGIEASLVALLGAGNVSRLGGANRYATAVAVNMDAFGSSRTVYLASGSTYADALSGAALSARNNAPVFLSRSDCIPQAILDAIDALGADHVVLLGGTGVLSDRVFSLSPCA